MSVNSFVQGKVNLAARSVAGAVRKRMGYRV